jgi:hypothetical protein
MRIELRRLKSPDTDWELLFGLLFSPVFLAVVALVRSVHRAGMPVCLFRQATGIPCPACGSYRAAGLLIEGQWRAAWASNPLATAAVFIGAAYAAYSAVVVLFRLRRVRIALETRSEKTAAVAIAVATAVVHWSWLVATGR